MALVLEVGGARPGDPGSRRLWRDAGSAAEGAYDARVDALLAIAIVVLAFLVSSTPALGLPVGVALAIYVIITGSPIALAALLGAAGVTASRLSIALRARARRKANDPGVQVQASALRAMLARNGRYQVAVFMAAATPLVPSRFLFPLLGAMRAPLAPAAAGSFLGQAPLLAITTGVMVTVARWVTPNDGEAAMLLGVLAIVIVLTRLYASIDWQHWRTERRFRMRPEKQGRKRDLRAQVFMRGMGPASPTHDDEDVLDVDVVEEAQADRLLRPADPDQDPGNPSGSIRDDPPPSSHGS